MDKISEAFKKMPRENFVLPELKGEANLDVPLPIGYGQTISQPTTVKLMLSWLDIKPGQKILDVGSGSGWTAALMTSIVGPQGRIYAVEKIPELKNFGENNCKESRFCNAKFFLAQESELGLPEFAPYDRILVSASSEYLPKELINQLKIGGKIVIPIKNDIWQVTKISEEKFEKTIHQGFVFVPLLK